MPDAIVRLGDRQQHAAAGGNPDRRRHPSRLGQQAEQKAGDDAGEGDEVRQDPMLEIDHEQHDHRRREQQPRCRQPTYAELTHRDHEDGARHQFHQRVLPGDRRAAFAAAPAQRGVADHRHVLPPREQMPARAAARRRPNDRAPFRKPEDADVQETADGETDDAGQHQQRRVSDHCPAAAPGGSVGKG